LGVVRICLAVVSDLVVSGCWREMGTPDFVDKSIDLFFHIDGARAMRKELA